MPQSRCRSIRGFTLLELIITVTILSVLLGIGIPSFRELQLNNQLTANANHVLGMLRLTRSEAVRRNTRVVMCRSTDQQQCNTESALNREWETGWIIFPDLDTDGEVDSPDEELIRVVGPLPDGLTLRTGGNYSRHIAFRSLGRPRGNTGLGNDTFRLCDERGGDYARKVIIAVTGRMRVVRGDEEAITCP